MVISSAFGLLPLRVLCMWLYVRSTVLMASGKPFADSPDRTGAAVEQLIGDSVVHLACLGLQGTVIRSPLLKLHRSVLASVYGSCAASLLLPRGSANTSAAISAALLAQMDGRCH